MQNLEPILEKVFIQKAIHDFMDIDLFDQSLCEAVVGHTNCHRGEHLCLKGYHFFQIHLVIRIVSSDQLE